MNLAFLGCGALALKDNVGVIADLPGGLYRRQIGDWRIVFNGTAEPRKPDDGPELPPFSVFVEFNGWPAGLIDPRGGIIAAGTVANEDSFVEAIETDLGMPIEQWMEERPTHLHEEGNQ